MMDADEGRRTFLKLTVVAGGGLLVGFDLTACGRSGASYHLGGDSFSPNSWIHLAPDGGITLMYGASELGQGAMTALPMILAEELEADWSKVKAMPAPVNSDFDNPLMEQQMTGGSTGVRGYWKPLRHAGAATRALLIAAAAQSWGVPTEQCRARDSVVYHDPSGRHARYAELLTQAAKLTPPRDAPLKDPKDFRLIGTSVARLDTPLKVDGSAVFGQDVRRPGLLTAVVARCPVFGGRVRSHDPKPALAIKGVRHVVPISAGIAVVADDFWAAQRGREALKIDWDYGTLAGLDSAAIEKQLRAALEREGQTRRDEGDALKTLAQATRVIEARYETPYLAHACMEPMNCTADVRTDGCDLWVPTQAQTETRALAAKITGLSRSKVNVHTTFIGGGFGRRLQTDYVEQAVETSKAIDAPVKVLWTREDDMRHDFYRPANCARLRAALDARGRPTVWFQRIAGPQNSLGGVNMPYSIPSVRIEGVETDPGVPVGPWRSVAASQNAFSVECFIDELAHAAGQDPLAYRLQLLKDFAPDHYAVLKLAGEKAGWGGKLPPGHGRGVAVYNVYAGSVAHVVEASVTRGVIRVHRVVSVVDCGLAVNPDGVRAQTESAVIFGLTAALQGEITFKDGRAVQGNFDTYPLMRIGEAPEIEVHLMPGTDSPGGVGEPGVPPIAPALANAIFAATGQRLRRLPLRLDRAV